MTDGTEPRTVTFHLSRTVEHLIAKAVHRDGEHPLATIRTGSDAEGCPRVVVSPFTSRAAAFAVHIDTPFQITLEIGKYLTPWEIFSKDTPRLLGEADKVIAGVVRGRYRERVKLTADGQVARMEAWIDTAGQRLETKHWARLGPGSAWQAVQYEPYAPSTIATD